METPTILQVAKTVKVTVVLVVALMAVPLSVMNLVNLWFVHLPILVPQRMSVLPSLLEAVLSTVVAQLELTSVHYHPNKVHRVVLLLQLVITSTLSPRNALSSLTMAVVEI